MLRAHAYSMRFFAAFLLMTLPLFEGELLAQTPETISVFVPTKPENFFPCEGSWSDGALGRSSLYSAVLGHLVEPNGSNKVKPYLVEFTEKESGKIWILKLREGLKFHHGRNVAPEDLLFAFSRHLNSERETAESSYLKEKVDALKLQPDGTLEIRLKLADPSFIRTLALSEFSIVASELLEADGISWKSHPVGAGPYRIDSLEQAAGEIRLLWHEKFHEPRRLRPLRINLVTDPSQPVDISLDPLRHDQLELVSLDVPASIQGIYFNFRSEFAQNENFRRALFLGVDRSALAGKLQPMPGVPQDSFLATNYGIPNVVSAQNIEEARRLISELGKLPAFVIPIGIQEEPWHLELQKQLANIGVKITFDSSAGPFIDETDHFTPFDLAAVVPDAGHPLSLYQMWYSGGPYVPVDTGPRDEKCSRLIASAGATVDFLKKDELTKSLAEEFKARAYVSPLFERPNLLRVNTTKLSLDFSSPQFHFQVLSLSVK